MIFTITRSSIYLTISIFQMNESREKLSTIKLCEQLLIEYGVRSH